MNKPISAVAILLCLAALPWFVVDNGVHVEAASEPAPRASSAGPAPVAPAPVVAAVPARLGGAIDVAAVASAGVSPDVLELALSAVTCATNSGAIAAPPTLTLIDYARPSLEPRLWVFDLATGDLLFREHVAHGANTGGNMATRFSDRMNSHQTSLGLFVTADTYIGSNGYSLRLDGLEPGFNGRARDRAIVMHGAPYVDAELGARQGRLGRSWGCPALREAIARRVIDTIRDGGVIFSYYPDRDWLDASRFLNCADQQHDMQNARFDMHAASAPR